MAEFRLRWLGVVSFDIELGGRHIIIDPFITDNPHNGGLDVNTITAADMVLISHPHFDHITDLPEIAKRFDPRILAGEMAAWSMTKFFDLNPSRVYPIPAGFELDFDWVKVQGLYGRHTNIGTNLSKIINGEGYRPFYERYGYGDFREMQEIGSFEYRNWLVTTPAGTKILCWGNNPYYEQRNLLKDVHPDLALLQLTLDPKKIARFAADIGARCVIPHHMDLSKTRDEYMADVDAFAEELARIAPETRVIDPSYDCWYEF